MNDSTKTILILAGLGAAGYLVYHVVKSSSPARRTSLALSDFNVEDLDAEATQLTKTADELAKQAAAAKAAGDTAGAEEAAALAAAAAADAEIFRAASLSSREKTAEYGKKNIKNYQRFINAAVKAMDVRFWSYRAIAGLYTLKADGKWGPKTQVASDAITHLFDLAQTETIKYNSEIAALRGGKYPVLKKALDIIDATFDSRETTEKALVTGSATLLSTPFSKEEITLYATMVFEHPPV